MTRLCLCLLLLCACLRADDKPTPKPADKKADAKAEAPPEPVFDGKKKSDWIVADFYKPGKVTLKDGTFRLEKGSPMTGLTYAKDDFPKTDYEVTFEARKIDGRDFFATTTFPVGDDYVSLVVGGWGGGVVGLSNVDSSNASENETRKDMEFAKDKWYRITIKVTKNRIVCHIDKEKVVDLDTTDRKLSTRIECRANRPFGMATYNTVAEIRGIKWAKAK